jgi:phospholipase/carboxylesterase
MDFNLQTNQIGEFVINQRVPEGEGPHPVLLLLHGLGGDETVMWIFTSRLSDRYLILAPRGLHQAPMGGYSWHPTSRQELATVEDLKPAAEALVSLLQPGNFPSADFSRMRVIGFSQGAALTYTLGLLHPHILEAFTGLSGFLPEGAEELTGDSPLQGKHAFIAHGTRDETIPVESARQAVRLLEKAGAQVTYCEEDVGHKLSAPCFRGMESFFNKLDR